MRRSSAGLFGVSLSSVNGSMEPVTPNDGNVMAAALTTTSSCGLPPWSAAL